MVSEAKVTWFATKYAEVWVKMIDFKGPPTIGLAKVISGLIDHNGFVVGGAQW